MQKITMQAEMNFWLQVAFGNDCWLWTGPRTEKGYGEFRFKDGAYLIRERAHRTSWTLTRSSIPKKLIVCHKCDVRLCVNPTHLFLGTQQDNLLDMINKGRASPLFLKGEKNQRAKLTNLEVSRLRKLYKGGSISEFARQHGIARKTLSRILHHQSYKEES